MPTMYEQGTMDALGRIVPSSIEAMAMAAGVAAMNARIEELMYSHGCTERVNFKCSVTCDAVPKE